MKSLIILGGLAMLAVGCAHAAGAHQLDRNLDRGRIQVDVNDDEARQIALLMIEEHCGDIFQAHVRANGTQLAYRCGTAYEDIDTELPPALAARGMQP